MQLPNGAMVAVVDGEQARLFRNKGDEGNTKLEALPETDISGDNKGAGGRHHSSSANPDSSRLEEDSFAAATAAHLNKRVLDGKVEHLFIVADPKTLGELRKHYHKKLEACLLGELSKDLTGHNVEAIETAVGGA